MRKKIRQKRKALYSSIYIPKTNVILLDENNSAILKQKKKMKLYSKLSRSRYTIWL